MQARQSIQPASVTSVSRRPWAIPDGLAWRILAALLGGLILRLWMMHAFPQNQGDALIYGNIAKNILLHAKFALTDGSGVIHLTLIRLPGYPFFLAACFKLFGIDNYQAIAGLQIFLELAACLLLADFVRSIWSSRAGLNTLWLAAMCPFTAVYSSAALTESLTFDCICVALWSLNRYLNPIDKSGCPIHARPLWQGWVWLSLFTIAISSAALLRPDGALLAFALWPVLLFSRQEKSVNAGAQEPSLNLSRGLASETRVHTGLKPAIRSALSVAVIAVLPFAAWGIRNWQSFHVFEPLAPRYANDPGEDPHLGWQHWVKTWCIDFTCTEEIYWNVPDSPLDFNALPSRAFDSAQQRQQTADLAAAYNDNQELTPQLDQRFDALARERSRAHPFRTHVLLPLARLADMTLRPRVENLTIDLRWWQYSLHRSETRFSWSYAAVNLLFLILGIGGLCLKPRFWQYMAGYLILRSLLLMTIEAPETRYTLEFFPILFVGGGIALQRLFKRGQKDGFQSKS